MNFKISLNSRIYTRFKNVNEFLKIKLAIAKNYR